ncbi:hypothetical protein CEP52_008161 [Fusarium oligoseptatum]|uniref:ABC transporter domain-containing protein n=1 Tax=Fusarium oligoseptatum TaxID=2604345 RepID=A0A428TJ39_9HYPO|nr:hypothetical protein CEP52_008161 [Fusarium oligoseptatum]
MGGQLTSQIMFPALAFFFNINNGLQAINQLATVYQAGIISFQRITDFLTPLDHAALQERLMVRSEAPSVVVEQVTLPIPGHTGCQVLLQDYTFAALPKSLSVISGPIGSGKSTFLRSLVGDVRQVDGNININGTIAYSPQVPILINGTVRDNILFGLPLDASFYARVIDATALTIDLANLAHGDQTMLGGTGAALSGGQKSRVALPGAAYSRRGIVILDDPLAALDAKVRKEVVRQVFGPEGILQDRIPIITSSCEPLLEAADKVYYIADGQLSQVAASDLIVSPEDSDTDIPAPAEELSARIEHAVPPTSRIGCGTFHVKSYEPVVELNQGPAVTDEELLLARRPPDLTASRPSGVEAVPLRTYISYLGMAKKGGWYIVILLAVITKLVDVCALFFLKLASEEADTVQSSYELV